MLISLWLCATYQLTHTNRITLARMEAFFGNHTNTQESVERSHLVGFFPPRYFPCQCVCVCVLLDVTNVLHLAGNVNFGIFYATVRVFVCALYAWYWSNFAERTESPNDLLTRAPDGDDDQTYSEVLPVSWAEKGIRTHTNGAGRITHGTCVCGCVPALVLVLVCSTQSCVLQASIILCIQLYARDGQRRVLVRFSSLCIWIKWYRLQHTYNMLPCHSPPVWYS